MSAFAKTPRTYEEALERIRHLEQLLGAHRRAPLILHCTKTEEIILGMLLKTSLVVTREAILTVLYGMRQDPPHQKILDVLMVGLRYKLKHHEIAIETVWGRGYRLTVAAQKQIHALYAADEIPLADPPTFDVVLIEDTVPESAYAHE